MPVAPPADGPVATIADRCVRLGVPGAEEQPSLYRLCRQWVQNDPDLGEPLAEVGELHLGRLPGWASSNARLSEWWARLSTK